MRSIDQLFLELTQKRVRLWTENGRLRVKAPTGVLTGDLRQELSARKTEIIAFLGKSEALPSITLQPEQRHEPFPLTDVQHAYWLGRSDVFDLGNIATHGYSEYDMLDLDLALLNRTWQMLIDRHDALRIVVEPDGQQRILAEVPAYEINIADLRALSPEARERALMTTREEMSHQVFTPNQWPLFEIRISQIDDRSARLHVSIDLLLMDAFSAQLLFGEWRQRYMNPEIVVEPLELSYRDYILAEQQLETSTLYKNAQTYWLKRVETLPLAPELPLQRQLHEIEKPIFERHAYQLASVRWEKLKQIAQSHNLSPSEALLTAFALVLGTWSKKPHFTLNLTLFNRLPIHPQVMELIGDFTNLILLEVNLTSSDSSHNYKSDSSVTTSFVTQGKNIQQQLLRDLDHRYFGGVRVLRELSKQQNSAQTIMPVVFTSLLANSRDSNLAFFGDAVYGISQTSQVWLDHQVWEEHGRLVFNWDVVAELFPAGLMADMFRAYCTLLERLADDADFWHESDSDSLLLVPAYQRAQRFEINATQTPISDDLLHTLFLKQVVAKQREKRATDPAVITTQHTISYQELYDRANQVGHWLREQGAKPNTLVAVVMEKGWEQVVAVLGIHLSGAAYLPIDPNLPTERRHHLLSQGETTMALTQSWLDVELEWPAGIIGLALDTLTPDSSLPALHVVQTATDLAYVIYTSGSTGLPKGVVIDHRGAVNTVLDVNRREGITAKDRVLALSALNFDLSVYDIFGLLAVGGAIVMPDAQRRIDPGHWNELMQNNGVTVWNSVPALMQMLVDYQDDRAYSMPSSLRVIMMSGDWIPVTLPDRIKALWAGAKVVSMGGATEASIWSIYYPIEQVDPAWPSIPYGKPMTNQTFHVLDGNLNPRPVWVAGDLYIGGIGLALGYWKDEARTNASFITHPISPPTLGGTKGGRERLYKTGDLGRYLPDGNIEFLGREDFQVKIRGHRIELGEIESTLLQHPGINQAVVNAVGDPKGHRQLVAYVVLDETWQKRQENIDQLPDVYDESHSVTLTGPIERLEFKLRQLGIRDLANNPPVALPTRAFDETRRRTWLARQSYRQFIDDVIALNAFSDFLSCLMQLPLENMPLPKYRYPSAGHLYPVQCYLYIKPARIAGLAGGYYYYQPAPHHLMPLQVDDAAVEFRAWGANQVIFDQSAFTLFLVANLDAIRPMYGEIARDFSLLEAGHISQLLMMEATAYQLGLCPIGVVDVSLLRSRLALGTQHELMHTLAGGMIDPLQMSGWLQGSQKSTPKRNIGAQLQDYLAQKLPGYMVPNTYMILQAMPLTANGKVNRRALPEPDLTTSPAGTFVAPRTATEEKLAAIWQDVLNLEQIGIHDDFFAIGGDSLIATRVISRVKADFNADLMIRNIFENSMLVDFADLIENVLWLQNEPFGPDTNVIQEGEL